MSSEDQDEKNIGEEEEEEEEEVEEEEREDGEEGEGDDEEDDPRPTKAKKRKFEESLPVKKQALLEFSLALPGKGDESKKIVVKALPSRKAFEYKYRAPLKKLRRENILKQLENDPAGKKAFLAMEAEKQDNEEDEEEEEEEGVDQDGEERGGQTALPTPFWLPYLLNNDTFYVDRILSVMYGYAVPPPRTSAPSSSFNDVEHKAEREEREEDEEEEKEEEEEEEEEEGGSLREKQRQRRALSSSASHSLPLCSASLDKPPLNSIPLFSHPNYPFFIAFEKNSEEWHLLDVHPWICAARYRKSVAEKRRAREERQEEEEERKKKGEKENDDDDDEENEEEEMEEQENKEEEEEEEEEEELDYDLSTIVKLDALMLAVLHSPDALRYILLQPHPPSLQIIEEWLQKDFKKGFFFLSAVNAARSQILHSDAPRLKQYSIPRLVLDYNYFFQSAYLFSMDPPMFRSTSTTTENHIPAENIVSARSLDAVAALSALLSVNIAPSHRIEMHHFSTVEGILLLLWLMLVIPKSIFVKWGEMIPRSETLAEQMEEEEEEEEEDDDEEDGNFSEAAVRRRIAKEEKKKLKDNPLPVKTFFVPSPLLSKLVLEIRRRVKRKQNGKKGSKFSLALCMEQVFKPETLENGRPESDPLVTSSFSTDSVERKLPNSPYALLWHDLEVIMSQSVVRHQKLYQSDLALLLLSLTWPQVTKTAPLKVVISSTIMDSAEHGTLVVRKKNDKADADANQPHFFLNLLKAKLNLVVSPLHKARSGTFRLLYLRFHHFRSLDIIQSILGISPLNQLFGVNERCPLPELIGSWMMDKSEHKMLNFEKFINMFWHELYYRVQCGLFERDVLRFFELHCPQVLDLVNQRYSQYAGVISILGGLLHRHSAVHHTTFRKVPNFPKIVDSPPEEQNYSAEEINIAPSRDQVLVTVINPSPYSVEYVREERRVAAAFESLPMPPRTYYTPETLFRVLFCVEQVDLVAVRFLMVVKGISTVRENPFSKEINALEFAISVQNHLIANLIVGLGFSMDDIMEEGRITLDYFTENKFDVTANLAIKETWEKNTRAIVSDPERQYGILRSVLDKTVRH